jgi:hypothetical protein
MHNSMSFVTEFLYKFEVTNWKHCHLRLLLSALVYFRHMHSVNDNLTLICTVDTLQIIAYGREIRSVGTIIMVYYFIRI